MSKARASFWTLLSRASPFLTVSLKRATLRLERLDSMTPLTLSILQFSFPMQMKLLNSTSKNSLDMPKAYAMFSIVTDLKASRYCLYATRRISLAQQFTWSLKYKSVLSRSRMCTNDQKNFLYSHAQKLSANCFKFGMSRIQERTSGE